MVCYGLLGTYSIRKITLYETLECIMIGCRNEAKLHGMDMTLFILLSYTSRSLLLKWRLKALRSFT